MRPQILTPRPLSVHQMAGALTVLLPSCPPPPLTPSPATNSQSHSCLCLHLNMPLFPPHLPDSFLGSAVRLGRAICIFPENYLGEKSQLTDLTFLPNGRWWRFHYESLLHDELMRNAIRWQSLSGKGFLAKQRIQTEKLSLCFICARCCL